MKHKYADARTKATKGTQPYYLRELDSVPFIQRRVPRRFKQFFRQDVQPRLTVNGYKRAAKLKTVMQCGFNALVTGLADKVIADTRNTYKPGVRQRVEAWQLLEDAGLVRKCVGSEWSGKVTRYRATRKFLSLRDEWTPALVHEPREQPKGPLLGLVVFKHKDDDRSVEIPFDLVVRRFAARNKQGKPDERAVSTGIAVARVVEEFINCINDVNLSHAWKMTNDAGAVAPVGVDLVQIHVGELWRGVRYYTRGPLGGQNLKKKQRARITIDGEQTVELDISGSLVRLAYHRRGLEAPAGDVYQPERIAYEVWRFCDKRDRKTVRNYIKRATQICFNASCRKKAIGAVFAKLKELPDKWPVANLPKPAELVRRIALLHAPIVEDMFGDVGMTKLIPTESRIMFQTLQEFVLRRRKPALAIHDGLRVKETDAKLACSILRNVFQQHTGFAPVIKRKSSKK